MACIVCFDSLSIQLFGFRLEIFYFLREAILNINNILHLILFGLQMLYICI